MAEPCRCRSSCLAMVWAEWFFRLKRDESAQHVQATRRSKPTGVREHFNDVCISSRFIGDGICQFQLVIYPRYRDAAVLIAMCLFRMQILEPAVDNVSAVNLRSRNT